LRGVRWIPRGRCVRYGGATAAILTVAAASMMLEPLLDHVPTAGLVAAVLVVAWFAGFAPAVFATTLGAALLALAPSYAAPGYTLAHATDVVLFVGVALVISRLASTRRRVDRERQQLLEAESAARARAERLSRAKDDFLAMVSHELRSPLTAIIAWVQVLRRACDTSETVRRAIGPIERNTLLQARLIEDLLDIARIAEGTLELRRAPIDAVPIVRQIVESYHPAARAKGLMLVLQVAVDSLPVIVDAQRMEQVVGNLVANALKFTPTGGQVTVTLERVRRSARIEVSDTGPGVSADVLPHIFEPLRQGPGARAHGGLGLGLAIVKHLVTLHGGTVCVEPRRGRGATFVVELPLETAASPRAQGRVLVVERSDDTTDA
jgi:signal transduction histidine kinase